ncbi:MAG: SAM-dependent methyltransferase [Gammaproteobacteria bacterium]|nr:SAM-dependent methyltransferase [Gammaproteobacteria bacterium]
MIQYLESFSFPMSFHDYMNAVLYAPQLGYYSGNAEKFGPAGDFITAPELTPFFARSLSAQFREVLNEVENSIILEIGGGTGRFALEVLRELKTQHALPNRYLILEPSPSLRARAFALFESEAPDLLDRVEWITEFPKAPIVGVIFANEVLDAMPVRRFVKHEGKIREQGVRRGAEGLEFCLLEEAHPELLTHVEALEAECGSFPEGFTSEVNLWALPWLKSVFEALAKGVVILIDYGYSGAEYYHPSRASGTLQCYSKHQAHENPFSAPGKEDITAHVNFTKIAQDAVSLGFDLIGYTTQMYFLMGCGLETYLNQTGPLPPQETQKMRRLLLPGGMGETFKVMGLGRNWKKDLQGFALFNQVYRL